MNRTKSALFDKLFKTKVVMTEKADIYHDKCDDDRASSIVDSRRHSIITGLQGIAEGLIGADLDQDDKVDYDNSQHNKTLFQLAREGDADSMAVVLSKISKNNDDLRIRKRVNALDDSKTSALHYAARHDNQKVVEMLVKWGADVNCKGADRLTPLHFAARFRAAAKLSANYMKMYTASGQRHRPPPPEILNNIDILPVIQLLAKLGARVNERDKYGLTPLHHASMRGNVLEVQQLLSCEGIDIEVIKNVLINIF